jgi:acetyl/propionyl-CoA carboxylase alpha subunit
VSGRALRRTYVAGTRCLDAELRLREGRLQGTLSWEGEAQEVDVGVRRLGSDGVALEHAGRRVRATVWIQGDVTWVRIDGRAHVIRLEEAGGGAAHHAGQDDFATSPMTGVVIKVAVVPGAAVAQGGELFVVEAMKMEYAVRAYRPARIAQVHGGPGDKVKVDAPVVTFEEVP